MKFKMMKWAKILFPINRSITGEGLRETIKFIKNNVNSNFKNFKIKSNKKIYDWKVPLEWKISEAYIKEVGGKKICDFKNNNLHVLGYSTNINKVLTSKELKKNIFYLKKNLKLFLILHLTIKKNGDFAYPLINLKN